LGSADFPKHYRSPKGEARRHRRGLASSRSDRGDEVSPRNFLRCLLYFPAGASPTRQPHPSPNKRSLRGERAAMPSPHADRRERQRERIGKRLQGGRDAPEPTGGASAPVRVEPAGAPLGGAGPRPHRRHDLRLRPHRRRRPPCASKTITPKASAGGSASTRKAASATRCRRATSSRPSSMTTWLRTASVTTAHGQGRVPGQARVPCIPGDGHHRLSRGRRNARECLSHGGARAPADDQAL
jgi:hypothetical protein